jgi:nucleoside-diphosphate-sugar epimerase
MTRVALTGASGFVGRQVLSELVNRGVEVHAIGRGAPPYPQAGCTWHRVDLFDADAVAAAMREIAPSHLIHLAWFAVPIRFWTDEENLDWVESSVRVLRAFAESGGRTFVGAGSCAEYAWNGSVCREDETSLSNKTLYAASKIAFHGVAERYCADRGLRFAWGRIFFAYGPGEDSSKLLSRLAADALAGRELVLRDPDRKLDYIDVRDVAQGFCLLALHEGANGAYNIGTGTGRTVRSMVADLSSVLKLEPAVVETKQGAGEPDVVADSSKLRALGWAPSRDFMQGLRDLLEPVTKP